MARKTKAELAAEAQERAAAREAHNFAMYPTYLMDTLELATTEGLTLNVVDKMFVVYSPKHRSEYKLPLQYSEQALEDVQELEWEVKRLQEERSESERRYQAKQTALAKLTKEERELLGL